MDTALTNRSQSAGSDTERMDMTEAARQALEVREQYRELEQLRYGREWSVNDLMVGLVGDIGDLAQLVGAQQGVRPGPDDLTEALGHELSDVLWSVFVLADEFGIDMDEAFTATMTHLRDRVGRKVAQARAEQD